MSFVNPYKNYYQNLSTWVSYRLGKKVTPNKNDASNLTRPLSLAATAGMSVAFSSHVSYQCKLLEIAF